MLSDREAIAAIKQAKVKVPETLMILGSGWNQVVEEMTVTKTLAYNEVFGVKATVPGHEGKLVLGTLEDRPVAIMQGRFHMYERWSGYEATVPIRVLHKLGVKRMVTTAAVGAINEHYRVGDFVILQDMITLFLSFDAPLRGPQFADLSEAFDGEMRRKARGVAVDLDLPMQEGVYMYLHGPNYETPADKMVCKKLGADVVGMSTVPETMMAKWLGMRVLGLALVTNLAFVKHNHREVLAESEKAGERMKQLLKGIVAEL